MDEEYRVPDSYLISNSSTYSILYVFIIGKVLDYLKSRLKLRIHLEFTWLWWTSMNGAISNLNDFFL